MVVVVEPPGAVVVVLPGTPVVLVVLPVGLVDVVVFPGSVEVVLAPGHWHWSSQLSMAPPGEPFGQPHEPGMPRCLSRA